MSHKTLAAFPVAAFANANGDITQWSEPGLSQYAFVAAQIHAAYIGGDTYDGRLSYGVIARIAFDHADAFFAELANRTK